MCLPRQEGGLGIRRLDTFNNALITTHIWSIVTGKESLWVRCIHAYKFRGRNFWEIPSRGNMTWSWRKILQLRPLVRYFIWYKLGDGSKASTWYDYWCLLSPISRIISHRDIHRAGFNSISSFKSATHCHPKHKGVPRNTLSKPNKLIPNNLRAI